MMLGLCLELVLPDALEAGDAKRTAVRQPAQPAVPAVRVELVLVSSDRGEDAPAAKIPFLDLVVVSFDVVAEPIEVGAQALLNRLEPGVAWISVRADAALFEEVVL